MSIHMRICAGMHMYAYTFQEIINKIAALLGFALRHRSIDVRLCDVRGGQLTRDACPAARPAFLTAHLLAELLSHPDQQSIMTNMLQ